MSATPQQQPLVLTGGMVHRVLFDRARRLRVTLWPQPIASPSGEGYYVSARRRRPAGLMQESAMREALAGEYAPWRVGDVFWVREDFRVDHGEVFYRATDDLLEPPGARWEWRPAAAMPRRHSRLELTVRWLCFGRMTEDLAHRPLGEGSCDALIDVVRSPLGEPRAAPGPTDPWVYVVGFIAKETSR